MTTAATLLALIAHAQQHVAALETLAASMTAGLRAGMVDVDHLYTLMATQTRAINAQLDQVVTAMESYLNYLPRSGIALMQPWRLNLKRERLMGKVLPLCMLSVLSTPAWALDGRCQGPRPFWEELGRSVAFGLVFCVYAVVAMALLTLLGRLGMQKLLKRPLALRRWVVVPTLAIGLIVFVASALFGWALGHVCF